MKENFKGYTKFSNKDWLLDFIFIVKHFRHELNTKLIGKHTFAHEGYSVVRHET